MAIFDKGTYSIVTPEAAIDATNKILIISTHGIALGSTFKRPFPTVIQFCTPSKTALRAALEDVIDGKVTASDLATTEQVNVDDYELTWFEKDPKPIVVVGQLKGTAHHVLVMNQGQRSKLSAVLASLKAGGHLYPSLLCVFCRIDANQYEKKLGKAEQTYVGQSYLGNQKSVTSATANQIKVNQTALALELQQKRGFL